MESIFEFGLYLALGVLQVLILIALYFKWKEVNMWKTICQDMEKEMLDSLQDFHKRGLKLHSLL